MAQDKVFIGICKTGKYEDQVDIGFKQEHIDKLQEYLDESPSGFVNCRLNKSKSSGKPIRSRKPISSAGGSKAARNSAIALIHCAIHALANDELHGVAS